MSDAEVTRLRRLRITALRVRALAQALGRSRVLPHDPTLHRGACAAWRIARVVSGRLRSHPHLRFQRDAGVGVVRRLSLFAAAAAFGVRTRQAALMRFESRVRQLLRELDDARALTWSADLSDALGRSQIEMRALIGELGDETRGRCATPTPQMQPQPQHAEGHSPYLAL
jgi:hypothetical protein